MKKYIFVAGAVTLILLGILISLMVTEDRTGPIITFASTDFTYAAGESTDALLKNVTANDAIDGDVTSSIMIADVLPMLNSSTAKITYVAKDSNDNITTKDIIIPYTDTGKTAGSLTNTEKNGTDTALTAETVGNKSDSVDTFGRSVVMTGGTPGMTAGNAGKQGITGGADTSANQNTAEHTSNDSNSSTVGNTGNTVTGNAGTQNTGDGNTMNDNTDQNNNTTRDNNTIQGNNTTQNNNTAENNNTNSSESGEPASYPYLTLTSHEVELDKGADFDALSYIENVIDDKDNTYEMRRRIHVLGDFDLNKSGDYVILYYAVDSEDNESNKEYLWIKVN